MKVSAFPAESTATQNEADGHDTPNNRPAPCSWVTADHPLAPDAGDAIATTAAADASATRRAHRTAIERSLPRTGRRSIVGPL